MNAIDIFPWDDNLRTGVAKIDEQHKKLVQLLNRLASDIVYRTDLSSTNLILDELTDYVAYHFETEEAIWHEHLPGNSLLTHHKEAHRGFVSRIRGLKDEVKKKGDHLHQDLLSFLTRWLLFHILQDDRHLAAVVNAIRSGMTTESAIAHADQRSAGEGKLLVELILSVYDKFTTNTLRLMREISERKLAEESNYNLAYYDPLTKLPNRRLLHDRLRQAIPISDRHNSYGAVLVIDLDNFKVLNDTKGHDFGDLLLVEVANRLHGCLREGDTVARLGGDEFGIVLNDLGETIAQAIAQTEIVGQQILKLCRQSFYLQGKGYSCSSSIGICAFRGGGTTVDELLKCADTAMYQAKNDGRNALRFYDPAMQSMLEFRVYMESSIRAAWPEQFTLHYQIQIDRNGHIFGAEALLRWCDPERGMIPPATFIPLAEEIGLIFPIGQWVLQAACSQLRTWENHPKCRYLQLAVNVSAKQLHQSDFVESVLAVLESTGANPAKLKLELTESVLVKDVAGVIAKMSALKARGVSFSLDDFGTGYSSLASLKRLPLDQVKIDQSFVQDILINPNDAAIVRTIVALAHSLGLSVIAEGVETQEQCDFLAIHGCNQYQGFLFSHPLPLREFEELVKRSVDMQAPAGCALSA